jgi:hypothetical protein
VDRADQSFRQPADQAWQDARQPWLGRKILRGGSPRRCGLGSSLHRHPALSHGLEAGTLGRDIRQMKQTPVLYRSTDAGGVMEISRWCKPPVLDARCEEPRQGRRDDVVRSPSPLPGLTLLFAVNRWLHHRLISSCPFGTHSRFIVTPLFPTGKKPGPSAERSAK